MEKMFEDVRNVVESLNAKAREAHDSTDALRWSQAALNAANAYCSLRSGHKG